MPRKRDFEWEEDNFPSAPEPSPQDDTQTVTPPGSKTTERGGESFPADLEATWLRYLKFQESRLSGAGELHPQVMFYVGGSASAGSYLESHGDHSRAETLHEAVTLRVAFLRSSVARKAREIHKLEKRLAELKAGEAA